MNESEFVRRIHEAGGEAYIVGGWPRDRLRGAAPRDKDYVVAGLTEEAFCALFPRAFKTGGRFPVYRARIGGASCEVAFARGEVKTGRGYRGFAARFSQETTIRDDLRRRDTTINSMALSLRTGELIDPFGGARDIAAGVIRATSEHFADDPVRALRAARQAAQFGHRIEAGTLALMRACGDELRGEPRERLFAELARALGAEPASSKPSAFFEALREAGILDAAYPGLIPGGAFAEAMTTLDRAAALTTRPEIRFAALIQNQFEIKSLKGEALKLNAEAHITGSRGPRPLAGVGGAHGFDLSSLPLPRLWRSCAAFAAEECPRARAAARTDEAVDLLVRLSGHPIGPDGFTAVLLAGGGLPPFLENCERTLESIRSVSGSDAPPGLEGPQVGEWVREERIRAAFALMPVLNLSNITSEGRIL